MQIKIRRSRVINAPTGRQKIESVKKREDYWILTRMAKVC